MTIMYTVKAAKENEIYSHLVKCSENFIPPLECRVNLWEFSKKIYVKTVTFEAWDNDILAGMISAYFNNAETKAGFINNVSIIKEYMGFGIASELLDMCKRYAAEVQFKEINLEVAKDNARAIHLYEKKSFRVYEVRESSFLMKWKLESKEDSLSKGECE